MEKTIYETTVVFDGGQSNEKLVENVEWVKKTLQNLGAEIVKVTEPGRRKLAYPINKKSIGYYIHIEFSANPDTLKELTRQYRLNESVLRYLTIILDKLLLTIRERVVKYASATAVGQEEKEVGSLEGIK